MMFLLKDKCSLVSQSCSSPHHALLVSGMALSVSHSLCVHVSTSADGDCVHGTAVADFVAASISYCLETEQAPAIYFWWTSKRRVEGHKINLASGFEKYIG